MASDPLNFIDPLGLESCITMVSCTSLPVTSLVYCRSDLNCYPDARDSEERHEAGEICLETKSDWYTGGPDRGFDIFTRQPASEFSSPLPSTPGVIPTFPGLGSYSQPQPEA